MSLFQTYRATEGLDQFPRNQQFWAWRAAHKRLKMVDPSYRARCRRFFLTIILASVAFALANLIVSAPLMAVAFLPEFSTIEQCVIALATTAVFRPYVLVASFRQQRWLSAKIAEDLRKRPTNAAGDNR